MDKPKVLSGEVLVAKATIKNDVSLPEIGLKDVIPNGSWLEQKQIQAALEARKHLIEVERIDKLGNISHATWQEDLQLAEVTQKTGGHWQYLGHNVGKTLYLRPEEALFMMEINCLLLKHNDVTVSLQKAYSLLLNKTTTLSKYKVYASLSRLGYRVYKHKVPNMNKENNINPKSKLNNTEAKLVIDPIFVDNISDQALTDSSVEILDGKINVNNDLDINIENSNEPLPTTETNNSRNEMKVIGIQETQTAEVKSIENEKESSSPMDLDENESKKNNSSEISQQILDIVQNPDTNSEENTQLQNNKSQDNENVEFKDNEAPETETKNKKIDVGMEVIVNVELKGNEALGTKTKNNEIDIGMEVIGNVELKGNEALGTETKNNKIDVGMEVDTDKESLLVVVDTLNTVNEVNTQIVGNDKTEDATVTEDAVNSKSDISESPNKFYAMEISLECIPLPDSTVEAIEDVDENKNVCGAIAIEVDNPDSNIALDLDTPKSQESISENDKTEINNTRKTDYFLTDAILNNRNQMFNNYVNKLKRLTSRECKPSDPKCIEKNFENVPDFFRKEVVTINVPDQQYTPKNIFVNNSSYVLNITQIKRKSKRSASIDSAPYNSSDEVNGNHVRRIRNSCSNEYPQNLQYGNNIRFQQRPNLYFRPYNYWRPQNHLNYVQFNMFFQRPCYPSMYFQPRFPYHQRPLLRPYYLPNNLNSNPNNPNPNNNPRKRLRSAKATHLQSIKNLAVRLKQLITSGNNQIQNIGSLHRLLYAYNTRFKSRLRLTEQFEVVNEETIVETIDLEEDDESRCKRPRLSQDGDKFNENLNLLRRLALQLKNLEVDNKVTSKHKRAMSKAIKTFNKSYDAEIYMNSNFDVIDKRHILIASDSESDCVVNEPEKVYKRKKLRNPFNILKRRTEKQAEAGPSTSKENISNECYVNANIELSEDDHSKYNTRILKTFDKNWLPSEKDFGRAEVIHKNTMNSRIIDAIKDEYLFNYIKDHYDEFNNWLEAKIAFLQHMEETDIAYQNEHEQIMVASESITHSGLKPLIDPEDCSDMPSVLEKLRIIKNNEEINTETSLRIDFDVYNRDVQNFKKTNPPKPHFRLICLEESSSFPSNADVMALHSKYEDNVSVVFAIVGISSISYLQINQINLPVYVAGIDLEQLI